MFLSDTAFTFDPKSNNHIQVTIRRNKFYVIPLADASGRELSTAELEHDLLIDFCVLFRLFFLFFSGIHTGSSSAFEIGAA